MGSLALDFTYGCVGLVVATVAWVAVPAVAPSYDNVTNR